MAVKQGRRAEENALRDQTSVPVNLLYNETNDKTMMQRASITGAANVEVEGGVIDEVTQGNAYIWNGDSGQWEKMAADGPTNALRTIDYAHHEEHSGSAYFISDVVDLALNNVLDIIIVTPDTLKWAHMLAGLFTESETEWWTYEGGTINNAGTAITAYNHNRNSTNTSGLTISYHTNTSLSNANIDTTVPASHLEHGIVGSGRGTGGGDRNDSELILKQNTTYVFRAIANAAGYMNWRFNWYEHTNIT